MNSKIKLATLIGAIFNILIVVVLFDINSGSSGSFLAKIYSKSQPLETLNTLTQTEVFSAHFDNRTKGQSNVVVLGLQSYTLARQKSLQYYCLIKYDNGTEVCLKEPAKIEILNPWDENTDTALWPYSFKCSLDTDIQPSLISLFLDKNCLSNKREWLPISSRHSSKETHTFGVCIQTALFDSVAIEFLIEGIERNRAMGAEWMTIYVQNAKNDIMKVLKDYEREGVLEIVDWNLSKRAIQHSKYHAESASIVDCLYRNMYRVKYLVFVDLDEIIVPQNHTNWTDMMASIDRRNIGAFQFNHVATHPKKISDKTFSENWTCHVLGSKTNINHSLPIFLKHSKRTPPYSTLIADKLVVTTRQKVVVKPALIGKMGIHSAILFINSSFHQLVVPAGIGLLYHYRKPPLYLKCQNCTKYLQDDNQFLKLAPNLYETIRERLCQYNII